MQTANQAQDDRRRGQGNLFEVVEEEPASTAAAPVEGLANVPEWSPSDRLKFEKEALDFYISSHPLAQHEETLKRFTTHTVAGLKDLAHQQEVFLGGMFTQVRLMNTKKARNGNSRYARCKIEDFTGAVECVMWPDDYVRYKDFIADDAIHFACGILEKDREEPILQLTKIMSLEQGARERTAGLVLVMDLDEEPSKVNSVANVLQRAPGNCPVFLHVRDSAGKWIKMKADDKYRVNPQTIIKADLETILGPGRVMFSRASVR
jgi:DNA polymerase-3 subunit alpha